jgi:hypothetical protein
VGQPHVSESIVKEKFLKTFKNRCVKAVFGLFFIYILGMSAKSPCKRFLSKRVCKGSSATAAVLLLFATIDKG